MAKAATNWLPVDVNYFDDPDIVELSDDAQLLDLRAMTLVKRLKSDGRLTGRQFGRIAPDSGGDSLGELVGRGIWVDRGEFLERRNWLEWNDSAAAITRASQDGSKGNHVRWHVSGKKPPSSECTFCIAEGLAPRPDSEATSGGDPSATSGPDRGTTSGLVAEKRRDRGREEEMDGVSSRVNSQGDAEIDFDPILDGAADALADLDTRRATVGAV